MVNYTQAVQNILKEEEKLIGNKLDGISIDQEMYEQFLFYHHFYRTHRNREIAPIIEEDEYMGLVVLDKEETW